VRPAVGAWTIRVADGGPDDADGKTDGQTVLLLDSAVALEGSPPAPAKLLEADLWFVIDPARQEVSIQKGGVAQ